MSAAAVDDEEHVHVERRREKEEEEKNWNNFALRTREANNYERANTSAPQSTDNTHPKHTIGSHNVTNRNHLYSLTKSKITINKQRAMLHVFGIPYAIWGRPVAHVRSAMCVVPSVKRIRRWILKCLNFFMCGVADLYIFRFFQFSEKAVVVGSVCSPFIANRHLRFAKPIYHIIILHIFMIYLLTCVCVWRRTGQTQIAIDWEKKRRKIQIRT